MRIRRCQQSQNFVENAGFSSITFDDMHVSEPRSWQNKNLDVVEAWDQWRRIISNDGRVVAAEFGVCKNVEKFIYDIPFPWTLSYQLSHKGQLVHRIPNSSILKSHPSLCHSGSSWHNRLSVACLLQWSFSVVQLWVYTTTDCAYFFQLKCKAPQALGINYLGVGHRSAWHVRVPFQQFFLFSSSRCHMTSQPLRWQQQPHEGRWWWLWLGHVDRAQMTIIHHLGLIGIWLFFISSYFLLTNRFIRFTSTFCVRNNDNNTVTTPQSPPPT